jgi:hypothetical protein
MLSERLRPWLLTRAPVRTQTIERATSRNGAEPGGHSAPFSLITIGLAPCLPKRVFDDLLGFIGVLNDPHGDGIHERRPPIEERSQRVLVPLRHASHQVAVIITRRGDGARSALPA